MSTTTSRVRNLLNEVDAARADREGEDEGPERMTRSELKETVKEGVTEALDEHERKTDTDGTESTGEETETESSGGRRIGKGFVVLATIAALAFFARRRRNSSDSEEF